MDEGWAELALQEWWTIVEPGLPEAVVVGRAQARENVPFVVTYGETEAGAEWGGAYINWEGPVATVACFTSAVDHHEAALRGIVPHPALLLVRQVGRNEAELAVALEQVERVLSLTPQPWMAAVRWDTDGFIVRVRLQREEVQLAERLDRRFGDLVRVDLCL